jgi:hypothetical protein
MGAIPRISPGELNKVITIQKPTRTPDGAGGWLAPTFTTVYTSTTGSTTRARIENVKGGVPNRWHSLEGTMEYLVTMRARPDFHLSVADRLVWTDRFGIPHYLHILSVNDVENAGRVWEVACQERIVPA